MNFIAYYSCIDHIAKITGKCRGNCELIYIDHFNVYFSESGLKVILLGVKSSKHTMKLNVIVSNFLITQ